MFINVVQKAKPLFRDFPEVTSIDKAKQQALANPIFSWHAKYLSHKHKKIVIFTNDATCLTIVLADINVSNRSQMEEKFQKQLADTWQALGMTKNSYEEYFKTAKKWQIGPANNRSQVARLNDVGKTLGYFLDNGGMVDQAFLSERLSKVVRSLGDKKYITDAEIPEVMQSENFKWNVAKVSVKKSVDMSHLKQICDDLKQVSSQAENYTFTTDLEKVEHQVEKIQKLNSELISSFVDDVKDQYSEKMVKSYRQALLLYLNEYLSNQFITAFDREASSVGELYLHGSSMTEVKRVQRSMAKFYKFLLDNKLIDADFVKIMKREMKNDVEIVELDMWQ